MDSFEIVGFIAAFLTTLSFVPQVYKTWKTKEVADLSLVMYLAMFAGVSLWLVYGIHMKSPSMIVANSITVLLVFMVIIFKIRYREK